MVMSTRVFMILHVEVYFWKMPSYSSYFSQLFLEAYFAKKGLLIYILFKDC
jgi:hypothetical protein